MAPILRALLSVSDKTGLVAFAHRLHALGVVLLSTGGTAKLLIDAGLPVTEVSAHTGFPEMMDGRVKTLHPKIHGGILARRDLASHQEAAHSAGIDMIDLVVVNLYPFRETVAQPDCALADAIENIDIGGPAMIRSAAKNYNAVTVVVDPADYAAIAAELAEHSGAVRERTRFELARKAFAHTAAYDGAIANWLGSHDAPSAPFAPTFHYTGTRIQSLRYGENPHQDAAFYRDEAPAAGSIATAQQLQGKALSYNNIADADAAWECVKSLDPSAAACVIVKHANPCGVATGLDPESAYRRAFACDPTSAFGGIIAFNGAVDLATAQAVAAQFVEVVIAPAYSDAALAHFAHKANVRVLRADCLCAPNALDFKRVGGGLLVQSTDQDRLTAQDLRCVTDKMPTSRQIADLLFAWKVAQFVKSNAIVFAQDGATLGVGAGQMSRLDSARIAGIKAAHAGLSLVGSVAASDAFFPFRDGLDTIADQGAHAIIQPGGSVRDDEVIAAANARGIAMLFTGTRHFRH